MFHKKALASVLLAAVLLAGCADTSRSAATEPDLFRVDPDGAKIFFYVTYDDPDDKPSLPEVFRLRVDNGYIQETDDTGFIATNVTPNEIHVISIDQVAWDGFVGSHVAIKAKFHAGAPAFIVARVVHDQEKPSLTPVLSSTGFTEVYKRHLVCICN